MTDRQSEPIGTVRKIPDGTVFVRSVIGWVCLSEQQWPGSGTLRKLYDHEMAQGPSEVIGVVPGTPAWTPELLTACAGEGGVPVVARYRTELGSEYHVHAGRFVSCHSQPPADLRMLTVDQIEAEAAAGHLRRLYEPDECPCLTWTVADMRQSHYGTDHHLRCDGSGHLLDKPREVDVDKDGWCKCARHQQWKREVQPDRARTGHRKDQP